MYEIMRRASEVWLDTGGKRSRKAHERNEVDGGEENVDYRPRSIKKTSELGPTSGSQASSASLIGGSVIYSSGA